MTEENEKEGGFKVRDLRGQEDEEKKVEEPPQEAKKEEKKPEEPRRDEEGPTMTFSMFILSMSTSALVHMGLVEDPDSKKKTKNLPLARQEIDLLGILQEKTKGNLDSDEEKLMKDALYNLRVHFVEVSKN